MNILGRIPHIETWLWVCVCVMLIALRVYPGLLPSIGHDSFQYLSVAENALAGQVGYTSLIHFDAERSFGVAPAPMVTFPPGYSLAIALVSVLGFSIQSAAFLISALSTASCVPLLAWIGNRLGWSRILRNATVAVFVFNATIINYGAAVMSEALFTFVVLSGVALVIGARLTSDTSQWRWAAAGLCFGAAYFVRYAGLFFVLGFAILIIRHLFASNRTLAKGYAIAWSIASVIVLSGIARNVILVGNWAARPMGNGAEGGGNGYMLTNALLSMPIRTVTAVKGLFLGPNLGLLAGPTSGTPRWVSIAGALFFVSLIAICIAWLISYRQRRQEGANHHDLILKDVRTDLLALVGIYIVCMFYASLTAVTEYSIRMFVPLLPLLILLIGLAAQRILTTPAPPNASRTPVLLALGASLCFYAILNAFLVLQSTSPVAASSISRIMTAPPGQGTSLSSLVQTLTGPAGVIVANNGQAVGHVLRRPTISLVGPHYSTIEWNEKTVRQLVDQFNAGAIVIYVPTDSEWNNNDLVPSAFVRQLAQTDAPSWMRLIYRSNELLIYAPSDASREGRPNHGQTHFTGA